MPGMSRRERHQAFLAGITTAWTCVRNHHGRPLQGVARCTGVCSCAAAVVPKEPAAFALWAGVILWEGQDGALPCRVCRRAFQVSPELPFLLQCTCHVRLWLQEKAFLHFGADKCLMPSCPVKQKPLSTGLCLTSC